MNIPNFLTICRIIASFFFLYFGVVDRWDVAFPIFCFAALTDMVDGTIARVLSQRTQLGAFLDPMGDKLLMFFCFLTLTIHHYLPLYLTCLVIARDLVIVLGLAFLKYRKANIIYRPTYLSKMTTFFQLLTILVALLLTQPLIRDNGLSSYGKHLSSNMPHIIWITAALTILTGLQYIRIGWRLLPSNDELAGARGAQDGRR